MFAAYILYDTYGYDYINKIQLANRKKELVQNFKDNKEHFKLLNRITNDLPNIQYLQFKNNGSLEFYFDHCSSDRIEKYNCLEIIFDRENDYQMDFLDDSLQIEIYDTILKIDNWLMYFNASPNHNNYSQIINLIKLKQSALDSVKWIMEQTNTKSLTINDSLITARFAGDFIASLDYIVYKKQVSDYNEHRIKLGKHYYYGVNYSNLVCGRSNWSN